MCTYTHAHQFDGIKMLKKGEYIFKRHFPIDSHFNMLLVLVSLFSHHQCTVWIHFSSPCLWRIPKQVPQNQGLMAFIYSQGISQHREGCRYDSREIHFHKTFKNPFLLFHSGVMVSRMGGQAPKTTFSKLQV